VADDDRTPNGPVPLERTPLREQIRTIVRDWVISGELEPGEQLTDRELGARLGASRTPVREALLLLAIEGLVSMHPQGGYHVPPLSHEEASQLYEVIGLFERRALLRGGVPTAEEMERLEALDEERRGTEDGARRVEADLGWHAVLLPAGRVGEVYRDELDRLKNRVTRYENAVLKDSGVASRGVDQHAAILEALREGDVEAAGERLESHWAWALEATLDCLEQEDGEGGDDA